MNKDVLVLVMSVGDYKDNHTIHYLEKIGGEANAIVCLPKEFEKYSESYANNNIKTYIYDEKKYINKDFEFFGFKPRNCGGIGRQGIAEAVEKYDNENTVILQLDDDTAGLNIRKVEGDSVKSLMIKKWSNLKRIVLAEDEFYNKTGIECMGATGATIPDADSFITNHKIFNNFIMRKGVKRNFNGFKALCSDDQRFNIYHNLIDCVPMISHHLHSITFHQNQGDRKDGNAVLYNKDCSWKKSFALKMMMPQAVAQKIIQEKNRILFRENIETAKLYPPICVGDKEGNIIGEVKW